MAQNSLDVGSSKVHVLDDGIFTTDAGNLFGGSAKNAKIKGAMHAVLVDTGEALVLLDAGFGPELPEYLEDRYELDLVVENLRGGHDTWDLPLLIAAGEVARDLGHALRLKPVILALAPGSPLDDLDESLRKAESGGMSGYLGRRRLRKIGAQQASLGWRSIIGKISAAVDWRD